MFNLKSFDKNIKKTNGWHEFKSKQGAHAGKLAGSDGPEIYMPGMVSTLTPTLAGLHISYAGRRSL